jgi:hypothetical protein
MKNGSSEASFCYFEFVHVECHEGFSGELHNRFSDKLSFIVLPSIVMLNKLIVLGKYSPHI